MNWWRFTEFGVGFFAGAVAGFCAGLDAPWAGAIILVASLGASWIFASLDLR